MRPALALAILLGLAPAAASACEFHGGPWGMAFARMMHAESAQPAAATPEAQAEANDAALAALRAQFLQRFNVKVEGEPAPPPPSGATAAAAGPSAPPMP
jgi:hypothetical protein